MEVDNFSKELAAFLRSQTNNNEVIELGLALQNYLMLGHTAMKCDLQISDPLISKEGNSGYIVLNNGLAGFRRLYNQEQTIKHDFVQATTIGLRKKAVKSAIESLLKILNLEAPNTLDLQWQACLSCLHQYRSLLTGGPGTGKTTTIIRLMLLYLLIDKGNKIALCAPTGKAANQMMQSISQQLQTIQLPVDLREVLSIKSQTIHRLLGYNNQTNRLKYNQNNPLPDDLVIIDEASMLDVSLAHALIDALKPSTQLVLIGDKNQLPAVEAGNVFADLYELLTNKIHNEKNIDLMQYFLTDSIKKPNFKSCTELKKNYRFTEDSIIAQMCKTLTDDSALSKFHIDRKKIFNEINPITRSEKIELLSSWYNSIPNDETRILLSPVNNGPNSVFELNQLSQSILYGNKKLHDHMPIIATQNDYTLGVFNGDIGELFYNGDQWHAVFNVEGIERTYQLSAIQGWQQANAISIHKSQGSEYDHVLIAIPDDSELNILTRSLLYTAISRAKQTITLWASHEILKKIIQSKENRLTFINN